MTTGSLAGDQQYISPEIITNWLLSMEDSTDYLHVDSLIPNMAYAIFARNAYVGIWLPEKKGFLISRYKMNQMPYLFVENHWDIGGPFGTAKPLRPLEKYPLPLPSCSDYRNHVINSKLCGWLDTLEGHNPPLPGWDSVGKRRQSNTGYLKRLARPLSDKSILPIWRIEL